jgi:ABC-type multidrug transport system fused ATPase/permease subunit
LDAVGVLLLAKAATQAVAFAEHKPGHSTMDFALLVLAIGLFLAKTAMGVGLTWALLRFLATTELSVSMTLASRLFGDPGILARRPPTQSLIYGLGEGVGYATSRLLASASQALADVSLALVLLTVVLVEQPFGGIVLSVAAFLVAGSMTRLFSVPSQRAGREYSEGVVATYGVVRDIVETQRELYVSGRVMYPLELFRRARRQTANATARQGLLGQAPRYFLDLLTALGIAAIALVPVVSKGGLAASAGSLTLILAAVSRLMPAVLRIQTSMQGLYSASGVAQRTYDLFDLADSLRDEASDTPHAARGKGAAAARPAADANVLASVENVSFVYPNASRPALENVSFSLRFGQLTAIVGKSGAGKTTLVELLLGLRTPSKGRVLIRGELPRTRISRLPDSLAYMPQSTHLVAASLAENVALGLPRAEIDEARLLAAVVAAGLGEVVDTLPAGLETLLGEGAHPLSGGERQRVGLARVLYSKAELVILDEPTSALDPGTEAVVKETLDRLAARAAVLIIAHRLTTIDRANTVLAFSKGRLVFGGRPEVVVPNFLAAFGNPSDENAEKAPA